MVQGQGVVTGRKVLRRGGLLAAAAALALLVVLAVPGCGSGSDGGADFARLLDADTAVAVIEWVPAPPAGGESVEEDAAACQQATELALELFTGGLDPAGSGGGEKKIPPALREAFGKVVGLLGAGKLFSGPVRYGMMLAPPADEMLFPSGADLLVASPTKEGTGALAAFLDELAKNFPDTVQAGEGTDPRQWTLTFPSFRGVARVRLAEGNLRAAFGGGSLDAERPRLLDGKPAKNPLADPLPGDPIDPGKGGVRVWIRPATAAEPVGQSLERLVAAAGQPPAAAGNPQMAFLVGALKNGVPGFVRETLASFARVTNRREGTDAEFEVRLAEQVSGLVRLFHEREGSLSLDVLAGVPADDTMQAGAFLLPPLDRLAEELVRGISPEGAQLAIAQLDQPLPMAPGVTPRKVLAAFGPELVFWRPIVHVPLPGAEGKTVPVGGNGLAVGIRDHDLLMQLMQVLGAFTGAGAPQAEGDVLWWNVPGPAGPAGPPAAVVAFAPDRLVMAPDRETAEKVLERQGGLGADPAVTAAFERLAGKGPVGMIGWQDQQVARRFLAELNEAASGEAPPELLGFLGGMTRCVAAVTRQGPARILQVGMRTGDGFRSRTTAVPAPGGSGGSE